MILANLGEQNHSLNNTTWKNDHSNFLYLFCLLKVAYFHSKRLWSNISIIVGLCFCPTDKTKFVLTDTRGLQDCFYHKAKTFCFSHFINLMCNFEACLSRKSVMPAYFAAGMHSDHRL